MRELQAQLEQYDVAERAAAENGTTVHQKEILQVKEQITELAFEFDINMENIHQVLVETLVKDRMPVSDAATLISTAGQCCLGAKEDTHHYNANYIDSMRHDNQGLNATSTATSTTTA